MEGRDYFLRQYTDLDYHNVMLKGFITPNYMSKYLNRGGYFILRLLKVYWTNLYLLCSVDSNELIGAIAIRYKFNILKFKYDPWLYGVVIEEDKRGCGLGKVLLQVTLDILKSNRFSSVFLTVNKENTVAVSLYKGFGFGIVEERGGNFLMCCKI